MKASDSRNAAIVAMMTIGTFLGNEGELEMMAREIARREAQRVARIRLAILGEIGFQQVALRLGLALECAQLHVLLAVAGRVALELIEVGAEALHPCAGDAGVVLKRTHQLLALAADLAVEVGDLRLQFLDARM